MSRQKNDRRARPNVEALESRTVLSITSASISNRIVSLFSNALPSNVAVRMIGANINVTDSTNGFNRNYAAAGVDRVDFVGGAAADRFVNYVGALPVRAWGMAGNDYLEGYNGADYLDGGLGNDELVAYGGNDQLFGGPGDDLLKGMAGNDQLVGGDGHDRLNGGAGNDQMWGGNGDDVMIAIDSLTGDFVQGDAGRDIIWVDQNGVLRDAVAGVAAEDKVHYVRAFANGADRTLDGDRIADPTVKAGHMYRTFAGNPLFSASGPRLADIRQQALGDCWLLAGLGAIANDNPFAIRQNVVDFDDGTYGVRLGSNYYRVDNDLPVLNAAAARPVYADLGQGNSMWAAIVEKAFTHYRFGLNTYASIEGGWAVEVNRAFGTVAAGDRAISSYANAAALGNEIFTRWNSYSAVTIGFNGGVIPATTPLINFHMYTVTSVARNAAGAVTTITLRNPWGRDGAGNDANPNDGFVVVTPTQLFALVGRVNWGRV